MKIKTDYNFADMAKWVYAALFFLLPVWFGFFGENLSIFELNKLLIFKVSLCLLIVLLFCQLIWHKRIWLPERRAVYWLWLLLLPLFAVNIWFSLDPANSFFGRYGREQGILTLLHYWLFFGVTLFLWPEIRNKKIVWYSIVFGSVSVMLYGYLQFLGLDPVRWQEGGRIFSTLGQPNFYGYYLALIIPLTFYSALSLARNKWLRVVMLVIAISQIVSLVLTWSRGGMIGLMAGLLFAAMLLIWKKYGLRKTLLIGLIILGIMSAVIASRQWLVSSYDQTNKPFWLNRIVSTLDLSSETVIARLTYWQNGLDIFAEAGWQQRLLGFGRSNQIYLYFSHYESDWVAFEKMSLLPDRAHNLILDVLLEFGLAGLLIFAGFNIYIFYLGLDYLSKNKQNQNFWVVCALLSSMFVYFAMNMFSFSMTTHYVLYYFIIASLAATVTGKNGPKSVRLSRFSLITIFLMFSLLYLMLFYLFSAKYYAMDIKYTFTKTPAALYNCDASLHYANQYIRGYSFSRKFAKEYLEKNYDCLQPGLTDEQFETMANNVDYLRYMIDGNEHRYDLLIGYSKVYSKLGSLYDPAYFAEAEKFFQQMLRMNPDFLYIYQDYAQMKIWQKDFDSALAILRDGLEHAPPVENIAHVSVGKSQIAILYKLLGEAYYHQEKYDLSLNAFQQAINYGGVHIIIYKDAADAAYQLEDYELALQYLKTGYSFNEQMPVWSESLNRLYEELGDSEKAEFYGQKLQQLTDN